MNKSTRFILFGVLTLAAVFMAACNAALPAGAEGKLSADGQSAQVEFTGVVDSIAADQWVVSGQTLLITTQTVIDGSIGVGNNVKVYATVTADGAVTADKIELPITESSTAVPQSTPGSFDDSGDEFTGIVEVINGEFLAGERADVWFHFPDRGQGQHCGRGYGQGPLCEKCRRFNDRDRNRIGRGSYT